MRALREHGVFVDGPCWYLASAVTPEALALRRTLCALWYGREALPPEQSPEVRSVRAPRGSDRGLHSTLGWPLFGVRAVRCDVARRHGAATSEVQRHSLALALEEIDRQLSALPVSVPLRD